MACSSEKKQSSENRKRDLRTPPKFIRSYLPFLDSGYALIMFIVVDCKMGFPEWYFMFYYRLDMDTIYIQPCMRYRM